VIYVYAAKNEPNDVTVEEFEQSMAWFYGYGVECQRMDAYRNGMLTVHNFAGYGWRHFDMKRQKAIGEIMQGAFPFMMKKMVVLNPPTILKAIMAICRLFIKQKILDRIVAGDVDSIKELVDVNQIPIEYGGTLDFNSDRAREGMLQWENEYKGAAVTTAPTTADATTTTSLENNATQTQDLAELD